MLTKDNAPLLDMISPRSVAAAGTAQSGWINAGNVGKIMLDLLAGVLGGGTVTGTWEQATSAAGAGAKDLAAWVDVVADTNTTKSSTEYDCSLLDDAGGFAFVRLTLTNVGGTGALVAAAIHGLDPIRIETT